MAVVTAPPENEVSKACATPIGGKGINDLAVGVVGAPPPGIPITTPSAMSFS